MPDVHVIQWTVAFGLALYITFSWLVSPPTSRWRHLVVGIFTTLLWIPIAYTAGNVGVADSGESIAFGSTALATFSTFMIVVCIAGLAVGLLLWTEEHAKEADVAMPDSLRPRG